MPSELEVEEEFAKHSEDGLFCAEWAHIAVRHLVLRQYREVQRLQEAVKVKDEAIDAAMRDLELDNRYGAIGTLRAAKKGGA